MGKTLSHTSSQASLEFRLFLVLLVTMLAIAVWMMSHTANSLGNRIGCVTSPDAQVCGTQVTRPPGQ